MKQTVQFPPKPRNILTNAEEWKPVVEFAEVESRGCNARHELANESTVWLGDYEPLLNGLGGSTD